MNGTILAVGAGGKFAGMVRDPAAADAVRTAGAHEVVVGDLADPAGVAAALCGIDRVFYIPPVALPDEVGVTFELCAAGWLDRHDVAALIGEMVGRTIAPKRIDLALLPPSAQAMRPMFEHYDRIGLRGDPLTLAAILGCEPRTLRAFFEEQAALGGRAAREAA